MAKDRDPNDVAKQRDEVIKRMIATPPKPHAKAASRRPAGWPGTAKQLPKRRTNKKRDEA